MTIIKLAGNRFQRSIKSLAVHLNCHCRW